MDLEPYVEEIRRYVALGAEAAGEDPSAAALRLVASLDAAVRLALQHALADAADEITCELAPGSVEVRVRGHELGFVVTPPPVDRPDEPPAGDTSADAFDAAADDDGGTTRINVRMPEQVKARVEEAAAAQRVSINVWLVRAAAAALQRRERSTQAEPRTTRGPQRYRGWAK